MATMGRPREFDLNDALDRAIEVFWRNGYEGASVAELCEAMGIQPPSLYAAFENKAGLFRHALDRYLEQRAAIWTRLSRRRPPAKWWSGWCAAASISSRERSARMPLHAEHGVVQRGDRVHPAGAGGAPRRGRG